MCVFLKSTKPNGFLLFRVKSSLQQFFKHSKSMLSSKCVTEKCILYAVNKCGLVFYVLVYTLMQLS